MMAGLVRRLRFFLISLNRWSLKEDPRSAGSLFLIIGGTTLLAWASLAAWERPCDFLANMTHRGNSCPSSVVNLAPLVVACGFWGISLFAWISHQKSSTNVFYILISGVLSSGSLSAMGNDWGGRLFFVLLSWLAPFTVRFHIAISEEKPNARDRLLVTLLYCLAIFWSLLFIINTPSFLKEHGLLRFVDIGVRSTLIFSIILAIFVAIQKYRSETLPSKKRKLRLIVFGTILGFPPLILLSLLPNTFHMPMFLPYEITFPFLLLGPLFFLYAIYRSRLLRLEELLTRITAYYLSLIFECGMMLYFMNILLQVNYSLDSKAHLWTAVSLVVFTSILCISVWKASNNLAYWALYGNKNRYLGQANRIAASLSTVLDRQNFCRVIMNEISNLFPITGFTVFLKDEENGFRCTSAMAMDKPSTALVFPEDGAFSRYLVSKSQPLEVSQLSKRLKKFGVGEIEGSLLTAKGIDLLLPLVFERKLQGFVLLAPCQPENYITTEESHLFHTIIFQGGIAAHSIYLTEEVMKGRQELARAHQQLLFTGEQERRRLAYELHDEIVQDLLGITYKLAEISKRVIDFRKSKVRIDQIRETLVQARQEILKVIGQLRRLIGGLRPTGLDELGLASAIESHVKLLKTENYCDIPTIELDLDPIETSISDSIAIGFFRVVQEALQNVLKHAQARHVRISLKRQTEELFVIIEDDGKGFLLPERLTKLIWNSHFGIVAMEDYITWAGGTLRIDTQLGVGTKVIARVPLIKKGENNGNNSHLDCR